MIPSDDILVNIVVLVNIAPAVKLVKFMTFKMHLSIGELEGIVEGVVVPADGFDVGLASIVGFFVEDSPIGLDVGMNELLGSH